MLEALVEGKLVEILNEQGIELHQTSQRTTSSYRKKDGQIQNKEFDIFAVNETEIIIVEVKTTLRSSDVSYFLEAVRNFKKYCPQYKSHTVYRAVAGSRDNFTGAGASPQYKSHTVYGAVAYLSSASSANLFA